MPFSILHASFFMDFLNEHRLSLEMIAIAIVTAMACTLLGVFLLLKRKAFESDAVSHSVLLGVVVYYVLFSEFEGGFSYLFAGLSGFLCLSLSNFIIKRKWLPPDSAIAISFSAFFAGSLVLIALYASKVHLDADSVMLGELVFVVFDRFVYANTDWGPVALYQALAFFFLNASFVLFFYKILQIKTFDEAYARFFAWDRISVKTPSIKRNGQKYRFHFEGLEVLFIFLTSATAVLALQVVGVVLSVAFFVTPAAIGFLLARRCLWHIYCFSFIAIVALVIAGYLLSAWWNASVAGGIAMALGAGLLGLFACTRLLGFR